MTATANWYGSNSLGNIDRDSESHGSDRVGHSVGNNGVSNDVSTNSIGTIMTLTARTA